MTSDRWKMHKEKVGTKDKGNEVLLWEGVWPTLEEPTCSIWWMDPRFVRSGCVKTQFLIKSHHRCSYLILWLLRNGLLFPNQRKISSLILVRRLPVPQKWWWPLSWPTEASEEEDDKNEEEEEDEESAIIFSPENIPLPLEAYSVFKWAAPQGVLSNRPSQSPTTTQIVASLCWFGVCFKSPCFVCIHIQGITETNFHSFFTNVWEGFFVLFWCLYTPWCGLKFAFEIGDRELDFYYCHPP